MAEASQETTSTTSIQLYRCLTHCDYSGYRLLHIPTPGILKCIIPSETDPEKKRDCIWIQRLGHLASFGLVHVHISSYLVFPRLRFNSACSEFLITPSPPYIGVLVRQAVLYPPSPQNDSKRSIVTKKVLLLDSQPRMRLDIPAEEVVTRWKGADTEALEDRWGWARNQRPAHRPTMEEVILGAENQRAIVVGSVGFAFPIIGSPDRTDLQLAPSTRGMAATGDSGPQARGDQDREGEQNKLLSATPVKGSLFFLFLFSCVKKGRDGMERNGTRFGRNRNSNRRSAWFI